MLQGTWSYEPLERPGHPFRARGLAYVSALKYVDGPLPGGRRAFLEALGTSEDAAFYDQIFIVAGDYDVSPLLRLYVVAAAIEKTPLAAFIEERARWSGSSDSKGLWKPSLHGATPEDVAAKLHFAFNRYFPPCHAQPLNAERETFSGELSLIPTCMNGLYTASTLGFYRGALDGVGATGVHVDWERPIASGMHGGTKIERLRFTVTWKGDKTR